MLGVGAEALDGEKVAEQSARQDANLRTSSGPSPRPHAGCEFAEKKKDMIMIIAGQHHVEIMINGAVPDYPERDYFIVNDLIVEKTECRAKDQFNFNEKSILNIMHVIDPMR